MKTDLFHFNDGSSYEQYMGKWSQLAGNIFLDWLAPENSKHWLDVGCGNGAFTEMLIQRCNPASIYGIDPSEEQLAYARTRPALQAAELCQGDAMALPYPDSKFDVAVMPLVIFFVPNPARGVAEMKRVVCADGTVAAYAWDMVGGGFPYELLLTEIRGLGITVPALPSPEASRIDVMRNLWTDAGLEAIKTLEIDVHRTFADFDHFWTSALGAPSVGRTLATMPAKDIDLLKARIQERLPTDSAGHITCSARANAVKGNIPV